jgi:hypothetical protein
LNFDVQGDSTGRNARMTHKSVENLCNLVGGGDRQMPASTAAVAATPLGCR